MASDIANRPLQDLSLESLQSDGIGARTLFLSRMQRSQMSSNLTNRTPEPWLLRKSKVGEDKC